jgi:multidrug efflux system outer membrane protein
MRNLSLLLIATSALTACSLSPDFEVPDMHVPGAYKSEPANAEQKGTWQPAGSLESKERGQWWKIFADPTLNDLEKQAQEANPSLQAAAARLDQARARVRASASTLFPTVDIGANAVRAKPSSAGVAAFGGNPNAQLKPYTMYSASGVVSYEVDIFGRVRDNEAALSYDADAQEALYRSTLLALQADVADHYFSLRAIDAERALLNDTIAIRTEAQRIMQKRFDVGVASEQDTSRTQSELANAQADLLVLERNRASLENALAVLLGKMPSDFTFAAAPLDVVPPHIPAGLPSSLLLRRPDVAAAQANMASANKLIGVARTGFFPILNLTASGGYESTEFSNLFDWSSRTWALGQLGGSALAMTVFDAGRTIARVDTAQAAYQETLANYRTQVLVAFKDVEDGLTSQRLLAEQSEQQDKAAEAATRTTDLTQKRYDQGDTNYFEVVDAQRNSLAAQRAAIQTRGQRLLATVMLIRALGGGWDETLNTPAPAAAPESAAAPLAIPPELTPLLGPENTKQSTPQP